MKENRLLSGKEEATDHHEKPPEAPSTFLPAQDHKRRLPKGGGQGTGGRAEALTARPGTTTKGQPLLLPPGPTPTLFAPKTPIFRASTRLLPHTHPTHTRRASSRHPKTTPPAALSPRRDKTRNIPETGPSCPTTRRPPGTPARR